MVLVAPRASDGNTHDIGFFCDPGAIALFHVTGDGQYADLAARAVAALRRRLIGTPRGGYISAWGAFDDERGHRVVPKASRPRQEKSAKRQSSAGQKPQNRVRRVHHLRS